MPRQKTDPTPTLADPAPLLLKPKDAARLLAISERKLWELSNRGEISRLKIGAATRYPRAALVAYVEHGVNEGARQ